MKQTEPKKCIRKVQAEKTAGPEASAQVCQTEYTPWRNVFRELGEKSKVIGKAAQFLCMWGVHFGGVCEMNRT